MSRVSRRFWLKGMSAGVALLATPFVRSVRSYGAPTPTPKRLIVMATPNGTVMDDFFPADGVTYPRILVPLKPLAAKLNILRGVDWKSAMKDPIPKDHLPDFFNMLTARQPLGTIGTIKPTGISVDQHIANAIGKSTKFASLQLAVGAHSSKPAVSSAGSGGRMPPEVNPFKAFDRLFADLATGGMEDPALARLRAERKSMLDAVTGELAGLRCELGAEERSKFDLHLDAVREIERGLDVKGGGASCSKPAIGAPMDVMAPENYAKIGKLHLDNCIAAFACDLTRVVTLQFAGGTVAHPWAGVTRGHHDISHGNFPLTPAEQRNWLAMIDTWYASQFAYLCTKLDAMPDPDGSGTLLDNTLCVWSHEQSSGSSHRRVDHPYVLAGGCGGAVKTGRVLNAKGAPHGGLLSFIATAMGVPTASFGDPDFPSAPLSILA